MPETELETPPILNVPRVVSVVLAVLCAVHALFWALGGDWEVWASFALAFIPARLGGPEPIPALPGSQLWTFFTYALLHADIYHLASNCLWLLIFSTPVARRLGTVRYLALLLLSAAVGAAAMLVLNWGAFLIVLGASASVSAMLAAAIPIMFAKGFRLASSRPQDLGALIVLSPGELLKNPSALAFAAVFLAMTAFTGASMALTGTAFLEETKVAWEAHLGGFVAGLILFYLLDKNTVSPPANQ